MTNQRSLTFTSDGIELSAMLFTPDGPGPFPIVVMAGGWCYVKELVQPRYAIYFADRGVAALIFDYRSFGTSLGEPRQHADPWHQIADYRNAVSFVETLSEVDASRIACWGISYSGGHVLIVGSLDSRVKCVISIVPVVDGLETMRRAHGTMGFRRFRAAILEDRRKRYVTGNYGYIKHSSVTPEKELCTWPFPASPPLFQMLKETEAPTYENRNTIASAELLIEYSVWPHIERLDHTPTMMLLADGDDFTWSDLELKAFNGIPTSDKKVVVLPGISHHEIYRDPAKTAIAAEHCSRWLTEHL